MEIRPVRPGDQQALAAFIARCSSEHLRRRFHGGAALAVRLEVERALRPGPDHRSWVAVDDRGIHGLGTLAVGGDGTYEVAYLVEDASIRRGIGSLLHRAMAHTARQEGASELLAWVQGDNAGARQFLRAAGSGVRAAFAGGGELEVRIPLEPAGAPAGLAPSVDAAPAAVADVRRTA